MFKPPREFFDLVNYNGKHVVPNVNSACSINGKCCEKDHIVMFFQLHNIYVWHCEETKQNVCRNCARDNLEPSPVSQLLFDRLYTAMKDRIREIGSPDQLYALEKFDRLAQSQRTKVYMQNHFYSFQFGNGTRGKELSLRQLFEQTPATTHEAKRSGLGVDLLFAAFEAHYNQACRRKYFSP